jgi:hypothetical protein
MDKIKRQNNRQHNDQKKKTEEQTTQWTKEKDRRTDNVNFPFICSNIPAAPVYGVCISQLIRYSRACGS